MLWLAVHLPHLPLEAVARGVPEDRPVAVVEGWGGRRHTLAVGERARSAGVRVGMSLAAAWALLPTLQPLERDPRAESGALARLAAWGGQFTPVVSLVPVRGLLLEIEGSLGLFGGLGRLREQVRAGLLELGYQASMAVAPTPLAAWLLAREGAGEAVREPEALPGRLARLPLACTDLPASRVASLEAMGVSTLGGLMALPREGLARRLGPEVVDLLDRALGRVPDPREPCTPPRTFSARLALPAGVCEAEALLFPLNRLVLELAGHLGAVGGGVERVTVGLKHPRPPATRLDIGLAGPSRDADHLQGLLRERLGRTPLPAPVEEVSLRARRIVGLTPRSLDLFGTGPGAAETWPQLVDRLRARLGPEAVQALALAPDHRPERAWAFAGKAGGGVPVESARRPLWLLEPPRALGASDGLPVRDGTLKLRQGPERIEGGWWDGEDVARDYYVAEGPAGERLWVFQERRPPHRWFLHGIFG